MNSSGQRLRVLFAASEAAPVARVGGLAEAAAGLIRALRKHDAVELVVVLPDYGDVELENETVRDLTVPKWVGPASVRVGVAPELGQVELVTVPGIAKPHPYVDEEGTGWIDNDQRFFGFSAAVAAIATEVEADVVHLNDWHTALALALFDLPTVFTIHTLGYQGQAQREWLDVVGGPRIEAFDRIDHINPVAGAIQLADAVVAVSPSYAAEIRELHRGEGLHELLIERGDDLVGMCNGIDVDLWDPKTDPHIAANYGRSTIADKAANTHALRLVAGWPDDDDLVLGMVTRMVDQKGIDLSLSLLPYLDGIGIRLFLLGSGEERFVRWARDLAAANPDRLHFVDKYDLELAHQIFAGADLFAMPSRFEPCGLAQMQAMRYGTIPVVTPVGGLRDTVLDANANEAYGNGFVAKTVDVAGMVDAIHRAAAVCKVKKRRVAMQRLGMAQDWSWDAPMQRHVELYEAVAAKQAKDG